MTSTSNKSLDYLSLHLLNDKTFSLFDNSNDNLRGFIIGKYNTQATKELKMNVIIMIINMLDKCELYVRRYFKRSW